MENQRAIRYGQLTSTVKGLVCGLGLAGLSVISHAQTGRLTEVTAQTVAQLATGTPVVLDLTRRGTVYGVAVGIDYRRVRIRTSRGEMPLSDLANRLGPGAGKLVVGTLADMKARLVPLTSRAALPHTCDGSFCLCQGFADCWVCQAVGDCSVECVYGTESGKTICIRQGRYPPSR
jgi:hypothetical protein